MEEKTFLKTLKQYFESKPDNEILVGDKNNIVVPMEWIFTEKLDREIIQRAMVEALVEKQPEYIEKYVNNRLNEHLKRTQGTEYGWQIQQKKDRFTRIASTNIRDLSISIGKSGIQVCINGLDNWTKAIIAEQPYKEGNILQISEDEFCEKILGVLKSDSIQSIVDSLDISEDEKQHIQTVFASKQITPLDEFSLSGIKDSMAQVADNLTKYYDYLVEEKKQSEIRSITIKQRQGTRAPNKNVATSENPNRKSPVYPFLERAEVLTEMKPAYIINVDGIDEEDKIVSNVYTAFVYENPRQEEGYLLVAEPLEGSHSTRIVYLTKEQFDTFKIPEKTDRSEEISRHYLEMSNEEFSQERNATRINHTDMEIYADKMQFVVRGKTSPTIEGKKAYYNKVLNKVYGQRDLDADDLAQIGQKALGEEVKVADAILDGLSNTRESVVKGENDD